MRQIHNRRAEQFLYMHNISFVRQETEADGTTVWYYEDTERFRRVMNEFIELREEKRRMKK